MRLLGVYLDAVTHAQALDRLRELLIDGRQHHVMTPNNEMLVMAQRDETFRKVLQRTSLNLPDSSGLLFAARWTGQVLPERVTGADTVAALCASLPSDHPVFLLGAAPGAAQAAADALQSINPSLRIAGTFAGSPREADAEEILQRINAAKPHLLFVAYGAPAQDLWIDRYLQRMPSVRVAMGVGGTLDFLAGRIRRAPSWMRGLHLEWAWRFAQEPSRWKRMWNAVAVFPWLVARFGEEKSGIRSEKSV